MSDKIWIEWIGLWGSGKTTCINNLSKRLKSSGYTTNSTRTFFAQNRYTKFYKCIKYFPRTVLTSLNLLFLLTPIYLRAFFDKDTILTNEFRSFLSCYLARLSLVYKTDSDFTLWEGELHLLPILGLDEYSIERVIDILLDINRNRVNAFVVMKVDVEIALARVLKDQKEGKNIRFSQAQQSSILKHIAKFNTAQDYLVQSLRERGSIVYEGNGDIEGIEDFIRSI